MLSQNYGDLLEIMFLILIGLLAGLTLLALNVQSYLETLVAHLFLTFEHISVKRLVMNNLKAHLMRNRQTG